ncbi:MAG: hypothetical protein J1F25_03565 [Prevotellaceae bacterium]|nr:hypothetical protein [Prevotellaceae bacterium]
MTKTIQHSLLLAAASVLLLCSCAQSGLLTSATFTATPTPLTYVAGNVPVDIRMNIPAKGLDKNAVVTCTPLLRWDGGSASGTAVTIQGEKVEGSRQIISYKNGGQVAMKATFPFCEGMENSRLVMTFTVQKGKHDVELPEREIGYGTLCTPALVYKTAEHPDDATDSLAIRYIVQGQYNWAAARLEGSATNTAILAQILSQNYAAAQSALASHPHPNAMTHYLRALLGARMEDEQEIRTGLQAVVQTDPTLARRALHDLEFTPYSSLIEQIIK